MLNVSKTRSTQHALRLLATTLLAAGCSSSAPESASRVPGEPFSTGDAQVLSPDAGPEGQREDMVDDMTAMAPAVPPSSERPSGEPMPPEPIPQEPPPEPEPQCVVDADCRPDANCPECATIETCLGDAIVAPRFVCEAGTCIPDAPEVVESCVAQCQGPDFPHLGYCIDVDDDGPQCVTAPANDVTFSPDESAPPHCEMRRVTSGSKLGLMTLFEVPRIVTTELACAGDFCCPRETESLCPSAAPAGECRFEAVQPDSGAIGFFRRVAVNMHPVATGCTEGGECQYEEIVTPCDDACVMQGDSAVCSSGSISIIPRLGDSGPILLR